MENKEQDNKLYGKELLDSEVAFIYLALSSFIPRNKLEETDRQKLMDLINFGFKRN